MSIIATLPSRNALFAVTCLEPDGSEHGHFLTTREFHILPKIPIVWNGAPTTLAFRHYHQGVPVNHAAMAFPHIVGLASHGQLHKALPLRGPVFVGGQSTWFHNFAAVGAEDTIARTIEDVVLQGEVRTGYLGVDFKRMTMVTYVSCQSVYDFVFLKMLLPV